MLIMVIRKMLSNKWMVICLLAGAVLAVAMVSSIPIYTDGVLQRMLTKDLEEYQLSTRTFPGRYLVEANIFSYYEAENRVKAYHMVKNRVTGQMVKEIDLPVLSQSEDLVVDHLIAVSEKQLEENQDKRYIVIEAMTDMDEHIDIVHGRMYSGEKQDGILEAIVTEEAMQRLDLRLDEVYRVTDYNNYLTEPLRVKIVGVFTIKPGVDTYWYKPLRTYNESFMIDHSLFHKEFIETESPVLTKANWHYAFDYYKITLENISPILEAYKQQKRWMIEKNFGLYMPSITIIERYHEREQQLKITLWVVQVPILLMLAFYIFMVSQLIVENEKNEIAVLRSRGASGLQVFISYLFEALLLSGMAMILGPPLGLLLCTFLGASNGFLEFVNRAALPISLNSKAYIYSIWTVAVFIITMLVPAYLSSRTTIVIYKQRKARSTGFLLLRKLFIDIALLGIAGYGLYAYKMRQQALMIAGVSGTDLAIDPLLFIISTLFILGAGLVFLRIFPLIVRLIFLLGRKIWSPALYASFIHVGRSGGQDRFLMLFIILTLSVGIFSANAARTLNSNIEEKIAYNIGADIVIKAQWEDNRPVSLDPSAGPLPQTSDFGTQEPVLYIEPPFQSFAELSGVESATKVFRRDNIFAQTVTREHVSRVYLMGIIPNEFGQVAWFRPDLLKPHWYRYLNLMAHHPTAALVSTSFKEKYDVKLGDSLWLNWGGQGYLEVVVYEFIDYWPTFNPNPENTEAANPGDPFLVVANLSYIQDQMALEPYEVWIKKTPDATSEQLYKDIENKKLKISKLQDAGQEIIKKKNDPMLQGTNGALTLGFIVTMTISTIGFLIYWTLSIKQRVLQFGIFRAMGLSVKNLIGMLVCEQILISGTAILTGIIIGGITSELFVPLLQMVYSAAQQVPPFKVAAAREDYIRIYSVVLVMLGIGLSVLGVIISRIKIHQAIKLGED